MPLKFKEPVVITARYQIVTPMFIGDAEQKASGISASSVKGALRFWWRALNWGRIRAEILSDTAALQHLHREESELFGSSAGNGVAAKFTLRVDSPSKSNNKIDTPKAGVQYLLGQGLFHFKDGYLRDFLIAGSSLKIAVSIHPQSDKKYEETVKTQLIAALKMLGLLGGLGSRSRKGFGSLSIESLDVGTESIEVPHDLNSLKTYLINCHVKVGLPPFTAFSEKTRIDASLRSNNPMDALNLVGEEQQRYRSYGRKGNGDEVHKVNGAEAEQNFSQDHDLVFNIIRDIRHPPSIPHRSVFGLPHNYFFSSTKGKADFAPSMPERSRRASPLFIHVHQFPNRQVVLIQTLMPATFLANGDILEFKMGNQPRDKVRLPFDEQKMINWQVIHNYMDRFANREVLL